MALSCTASPEVMMSLESVPKIASTESRPPVFTAVNRPFPASSGEANVVCEGFAVSVSLQPANITIRASSINQEVKEILRAAFDIPIPQTFELSDSSTLSLTKAGFTFGLPNHHHRPCSLHHEHWRLWTANRHR